MKLSSRFLLASSFVLCSASFAAVYGVFIKDTASLNLSSNVVNSMASVAVNELNASTHMVVPKARSVVENALPGVVTIYTLSEIDERHKSLKNFAPFHSFFHRQNEIGKEIFSRAPDETMENFAPKAFGAGFVIDKNGTIVTNEHLISGGDVIRVTFSGEEEDYEAELLGSDKDSDIAVLKIKPRTKLTVLELGDSDEASVGDKIFAIGSPYGLINTVTSGIISAKDRIVEGIGPEKYIQLDASLNNGSSGGPMIDEYGRVIGISTAILSTDLSNIGIGFAIPMNRAKVLIDQIVEKGRVIKSWIGVVIQPVTRESYKSFKLPSPKGAVVASVSKDGPSESAKIKIGDVILSFNGVKISSPDDLIREVRKTPINTSAKVVVWRDAKEKTLRVQVAEMPSETSVTGKTTKIMGMKLEKSEDGIRVVEIEKNSYLAGALKKGDQITDIMVNGKKTPVESVEQFKKELERLRKNGENLTVFITNKGDGFEVKRYLSIPLR